MSKPCECMRWARDGKDGAFYEHHRRCKSFNPEKELIALIKELIKGIECWAGDEDGVHYECWEAYKKAKWMIEGKIV